MAKHRHDQMFETSMLQSAAAAPGLLNPLSMLQLDAPKTPQDSQDGAKTAPRRAQDVPKTPQDSQDGAKMAPSSAQDVPKTPQDAPQEWKIRGSIWDGKLISSGIPSRPRFWTALGSILGSFGIDFGGRELEFSIIFGLFWA